MLESLFNRLQGWGGQSLVRKNCHNSRIGNDIDMKLEPGTKIDK